MLQPRLDRTAPARRRVRLSLLISAVVIAALELGAQSSASPADQGESLVFSAFPDSDLYPDYVADPLRPQSALMIASVLDSEIPDSGDGRFVLRLGGNFSLFRVHPAGEPNRGLQLDFKGGFFGHFDVDQSLDNIGWDGLYGLMLTWRPTGSLGLRVGTLHDSAHVGDEYAERTGRERIGYTRQEWVAGSCWTPSSRWRAYVEVGWGFDLEEFQEPLRLQVGVEASGRRRFWNDRASWYAAADVGAYEEWDWDARLTMQAGIAIRTGRGSQRYRLAIEYANGRSALGEFTPHEESTLGLGWFFDF